MRAFVQAVRGDRVLGDGIAHLLQVLLARGTLTGGQFGVALVIALLVTGSYGPGDRRRDPRRLFAAAALATAMPMWAALWTRGVDLTLLQYAVTAGLVWIGLLSERRAAGGRRGRARPPGAEGGRRASVRPRARRAGPRLPPDVAPRRRDQAGLAGPGDLRPGADRLRRPAVPGAQVPDDAARRLGRRPPGPDPATPGG